MAKMKEVRVKVIKYCKANLLENLMLLKSNIYLYFYDLDEVLFDNVIAKLSFILNEVNANRVKKFNRYNLLVYGKLDSEMKDRLTLFVDTLDIGEMEISEYNSIDEVIKNIESAKALKMRNQDDLKEIYINKDENVIQLYNIK